MHNENDFIDKLYSEKLGDNKFQTTSEEWDLLNAKLSKSNFLKFSFTSFNIIYLAVLVSFAGTALFFGVGYHFQSKKIQNLEQTITILNDKKNDSLIQTINEDTVSANNTDRENEIVKTNEPVLIGKKTKNQARNQIISANDSIVKLTLSAKTDTSQAAKVDTTTLLRPEPPKIKRIKKTVFVKQDNVVIKDTVVINKKSK